MDDGWLKIVVACIGSPVLLYLLWSLIDYLKYRGETPLKKLEGELSELKKLALRREVCDDKLSDKERLSAYDEYKKLGGNSWLDVYVKEKWGLVVPATDCK